MIFIVTKQAIWGEAETFTEAINIIEENLEEFEHDQKICLVDFETKQTMFLKTVLKAEEY